MTIYENEQAHLDEPRYVYAFYASDGHCLYVGCTMNISRRIRQHQNERPWAEQIARIVVTVHADYASGIAAEAALIRAEQPEHNTIHTLKRPIKALPCAKCRSGRHENCLALNRDGEPCRCTVCVRPRVPA